MAIVRWESAGDYGSLQREINQLFSSFSGGTGARRSGWVPQVDLHESEDGYVLLADLPGVSAEDVAIDVERNVLTLSGARSRRSAEQDKGLVRAERSYGSFRRQLTMPDGVDPDEIVASFDRGVLEIRIPKPVKARPRRITIDTTGGHDVIDAGTDDQTATGKRGESAEITA
ncbi:Hsp20/alpha crystallin family protein [Patulibacter minatonensis]|uniref:Hsp20/alpha crystallin family protein n=1 Tax=Patulibacter minatonensis TaxID=298163 RepID=UPI000687C641|nr:Hsp20/alpha crystallin family protein [Patulibacter minatonensis]